MIALKILDMLLRLYMLIVLAVVIIRVLQVTPNKWTNLLDRMTEPLPVSYTHLTLPTICSG